MRRLIFQKKKKKGRQEESDEEEDQMEETSEQKPAKGGKKKPAASFQMLMMEDDDDMVDKSQVITLLFLPHASIEITLDYQIEVWAVLPMWDNFISDILYQTVGKIKIE